MKTKYLMILVSAALLVSGCIKEKSELPGRTTLKARLEATGTRVSIGNVDGKLTWNEGDEIAVHVGSAYQNVTIDPASEQLSVAENESSYRNYYAVYPASVAVAGDYGNPDLKVTLPDSYDISDIVDGTSTTTTAEFAPLPMVADNDRDNSILYFYHVGGLLRVTLNGVKPATKYVRISFDKDVTGTYTVADPGTDHPTITTAGTETNNAVTFTLTSNTQLGSTLAAGPIVLNVPVPCGSYAWVKVECLNSSNTVIASKTFGEKTRTFQRHHGKRLSDDDMAYSYTFGFIYNQTYTYTGGSTTNQGIISYKQKGSTREPVPFTLEYSEDDGATWTTTPPSWMTFDGVDLNGSTVYQTTRLTVAPQVPEVGIDVHHEELKKDSRDKNDFDLSTINVATGATVSRTTANCYVVQGSGSYKFPLVYGNGVVGGAVNESAYRGRKGVDGEYRPEDATMYNAPSYHEEGDYNMGKGDDYNLGRFKDHLDQNIMSPYIATQQSGKTLTAALLWTDAPDLVTDVALTGSGEDVYITFNVPKETITQGNALVAVLADGVVAWSWHIWITEEDLTQVGEGCNGNWFAPVNIGWCEGKTENYPMRICKMRATQSVTGTIKNATITSNGYVNSLKANNPYYQYGRKDPMPAGDGSKLKTYYFSSDEYKHQNHLNDDSSIGKAIQHPYWFYICNSLTGERGKYLFYYPVHFNLWNSTHQNGGDPSAIEYITKTIYDPSPVGYKLPDKSAWNDFTEETFPWISENGVNGRKWNEVFFPAAGYLESASRGYVSTYNSQGAYPSAHAIGAPAAEPDATYFSMTFNNGPSSQYGRTRVNVGNGVTGLGPAFSIRSVRE